MAENNAPFLVADLSNSRTKIAPACADKLGERTVIPSAEISPERLREELGELADLPITIASVVPEKTAAFREVFTNRILEVGPELDLGVDVDFPDPTTIGPDRLANAAAAVQLAGAPSVVVDFGTAVTFDVISADSAYIGGVIAPGLEALTDYLHQRTALLPKIDLREPPTAVGKTTEEAMLAGAVIGYRGLVREILAEVAKEVGANEDENPLAVIATGGYAELIAGGVPEVAWVEPNLTLEGVRQIALRNPL